MFLDVIGALTSLLATYYFIRLDSKAWVISLVATCCNSYLYWQKGIYADMVLEFLYFLSTCYGWYSWCKPEIKQGSAIVSLSTSEIVFLLLTASGICLFTAILLATFTDSQVVLFDALTTSLSLVAQWLMCQKASITWIVWFVSDSLYCYLYFQKQIPIHGLLMVIYAVMAVIGYLVWSAPFINQPSDALSIDDTP